MEGRVWQSFFQDFSVCGVCVCVCVGGGGAKSHSHVIGIGTCNGLCL